ncbi:P-loop containing nucleoside triphosphate hydrolase protein [Coniochaeta ligniaria NRRL 30616]|uniref:p-loop containing nucleoside triphosphate hydrolase protein n=1 Tax=Coniochaeta ligniaria NRRL 30616 TaxID=1408157 RepID=A0A1J7IZK2_9PEZI|nr:P-loop containing nucleoside triphosphate hydrolase protein [Coniochaeta ligniaria NRRL 30616]
MGMTEKSAVSLTGATPTYYLRIYSVAIIHALRSVVKYYPEQDLAGDVIEVYWPYPVLVHHYDELRSFREACAKKDPSELCVRENHLDDPLQLLLNFLDREVMEQVNAEKERNERGYTTFDYLWVAHKPGAIQLARAGKEIWNAGIVHSLEGGIYTYPRSNWLITTWSLVYDGKWLRRESTKQSITKFDGEELYSQESIMIVSDQDFEKGHYVAENAIVKRKIDYGKSYWDLMLQQCRHHEGLSTTFPEIEVRGMVMTDMMSYYELPQKKQPMYMNTDDLRDFISDCRCQGCEIFDKRYPKAKKTSKFQDYTWNNRSARPILDDNKYLLCPYQLPVFVFGTRTWEMVHIKNLSAPRFQRNMIDTLVMDEQRRKTLASLTESFARLNHHGKAVTQELWQADFVENKGNGLIFLLHGGPGVGKTFTAECIAHSLERPLFVLRASDIGTDPLDVENNLSKHFNRAKSWNAVLLIDEADVFLAQRSIKDLVRSSLFYDGILFLTTNRVGTFDDAILSRVHVQLFYPDLDEEQRYTLWTTFIKKLEADRPSMQVKYAVKEYLRSSEMRKFKMNGREIRNAFQTAVALAEHRAEEGEGGRILLTEEHLREIVELNRSFKTYFDDLHGSEGKRAYSRGERLDSFLKAIQDSF